ncbi:MAG: potassium channel family protein [Desulfuromonadaceae bacterium]
MERLHNIFIALILLGLVLIMGTAGYIYYEDWTLLEAFYMTVVTISTVGFGEVHPLSEAGRLFTSFLIISGTGILAYTLGSLVQFMVEGKFREIIGLKKMQQQIDQLSAHYIICGYGRIGRYISNEFSANGLEFVIVEQNADVCEMLKKDGYIYIQGDATVDATLESAGINRARGIVTAVTSDTDNVYITLTARGLNPELYILARSGEDSTEKKLIRAGASKVVSPYTIGASRMAQAILRPSVVDFIDIATGYHHLELQIEEIRVGHDSQLVGKTLQNSPIRSTHNIIIVAIRKSGASNMTFNPAASTEINADDTLIILGKPDAIKKLEQQAR